MSKVFVTKENLAIKGVYLVETTTGKPVFHQEFVTAQRRAEYIITFAKLAKGKDFVGKQADSLETLKAEVLNILGNKITSYVKEPKAIKLELHDQLKSEALNFVAYQEKKHNSTKVNEFLQEFNIIKKFEDLGLYFDESEIVELNKIYTIDEIVKSVESIIELL
jgi:hypothetical protein